MRYLKLRRCDGIYDFIPLEATKFGFIQTDDHEYRVEIACGGYGEILFDKICITDLDAFMANITSMMSDGEIIAKEDLL